MRVLPSRPRRALVAFATTSLLLLAIASALPARAAGPTALAPLGAGGAIQQASAAAAAAQDAGTREAAAVAQQPATLAALHEQRIAATLQRGGIDAGALVAASYRSQFDGSTYADGNCGTASLAMALSAFGHDENVHMMRESINAVTGDWGIDSGLTWSALLGAAQARGFAAEGPFGADGTLRGWSLDELLAQAAQGRPVLVLVHYRSLPGHENAGWYGDHYVVVLGTTADGRVVYHDPAFRGVSGAYRTLDRATFEHAWANTWAGENRTAMAVWR